MTENPWFDTLPGPKLKKVIAEHGDALKERHHTDDVYFAIWLHTLDRSVQRRVLVSYQDLEDWDYWSAYDAGMSPRDAAVEMLQDNGWDGASGVDVIG
jgi:Family of unknown function (DUF5419)